MMSNEQKKEPVTGTPAEKAAEEAAKTAQDAAEALQNLAAAVDPAAKTAPAASLRSHCHQNTHRPTVSWQPINHLR